MKEFNLSIEENLYAAPYFYEVNTDGTTDIYYPSFISIILTTVLVVCACSYNLTNN